MPTTTDTSRQLSASIALLIDADNAPAAKIDFIITELAAHGVVNIRRAYGNWKKRSLGGWEKKLHEYAIQPIQQFDIIKGKNATDMALVIDAMDMLHTKTVDAFCLVSSDSDFTPLCKRLREEGKQVIGFGRQKTPEPFVNSCNRFLYLDETDEEEPSKTPQNKKETSIEKLKQNTKLMNILRTAVKDSADEDGWACLGPVGSRISNAGPFDHRTYGFKKLSDMFEAIDLFIVKKTKNNNRTSIRVKLRKTK